MKVLDLGCHDGFVGAFLMKQRPDVVVDGIEPHPRGVEEALRRGYRQVEQGLAEDAPRFFQPGSFDAVVCFELIEHVPYPDRLLEVCETMLRPGGVVYVSTPDCTFGDGNNPHHLRVYRSIDLAELLRRRGQLVDMAVGQDGITVGAYTPAPKRGEVTIHTGAGWMRWSPLDIETRGLGGSETAAVKLADALADQGYVVTVYGDVEQSVVRQVSYRSHEAYDPMTRRDLFIASRLPELFDRPVNAGRSMLWLHDVDCGDRITPDRMRQVDDVLVLSGWHEQHVADAYPWLASKLRRIRNGIDLSLFANRKVQSANRKVQSAKRQKRVLYTSSPDRGLDVLLELWPEVRKRVPGATLEFAYAPVYQRVAQLDATVGAHAARIAKLAEQKGVTALGALSQPALAKLMQESLVWVCPSYNTPHETPFKETSCIGAMEAQAAGCHVVASNWGALPETVKVGALVDGPALSEKWKSRFIDQIIDGLTRQGTQEHAQHEGPRAVEGLGWDGVARMVEDLTGTGEEVAPPQADGHETRPALPRSTPAAREAMLAAR